jgi:hypothetical protein
MNAKPTASLTAGLLARKGEARPAMRPQLYNFNDDLGFDDHGHDVLPVRAPLMTADEIAVQEVQRAPEPVVVQQQAALVEAYAAPVVRPRAAPGSKPKAAFTLRLDPERHLKLRLAVAHHNRSAQMLVTDALDRFLDEVLPSSLVSAAGVTAN